jgi:hypothetical protein
MPVGYVQVPDIEVMRVKADMKRKGPPAAFDVLESKLSTLKGRRFYGTFQLTADGEEYWACVARIEEDDPKAMQLETGVIPGGWYARRKVEDWEKVAQEGKLPKLFENLASDNAERLDTSRPSIEFYRSREELLLMVPVQRPPESKAV